MVDEDHFILCTLLSLYLRVGLEKAGDLDCLLLVDGKRTVKLSRVIYFQVVIWTLGRVELEVCE